MQRKITYTFFIYKTFRYILLKITQKLYLCFLVQLSIITLYET